MNGTIIAKLIANKNPYFELVDNAMLDQRSLHSRKGCTASSAIELLSNSYV